MNSVQYVSNRTKFANQQFSHNFYSLHFSVGHVLMIPSPSEKKKEFNVSKKSKVKDCDGNLETYIFGHSYTGYSPRRYQIVHELSTVQ